MYKRLSAILFPIATLLLIGALVWGYQENQEKNSILIKAENQYQRAFHDLSYHVDRLHSQLGNTLAVHSASTGSQRKGLVNVWRITSEAQNEINQLPLTMLPFSKTEEFLSRISNFSYQTAVRDMTKQPLTDNEVKNLKELYNSSAQISKDLQDVQDKVISNRLRWMDVETALATNKEAKDNTIIDGFKTVDKKVGEYPELDWGPSVSSMYTKRSVKKLGGTPITTENIKHKAAQFIGHHNGNIKVVENGRGTEWASYTAKSNGKKDETYTLDYTRNGGHLISYSCERTIGPRSLGYKEARAESEKFLKEKGYPNMTAVSYDQYDNIGSLTFVNKQGDVLIYPEKVTVRVGLDNGQVTGLQASDYVYEREVNQKIPKPKLTVEQARKYLNSDFKEKYNRLSLIKNELSDKVLTYEFGGSINGKDYRIYINAENGTEENIEEIRSNKPTNKTENHQNQQKQKHKKQA
ncbi:germination protein YpeB [Paenibacillus lutimineralis]|uniref:Germination protein YpeB n=1 Tax=Paenibacillus lutimineralis TaxID=2707005 RepID=A0A3Q9I870_9BACL|nr:germination protein YpeB [Paenibacillus lutimineralis]AZS14800.1 germination protein YpeB [Paenibacillus lutimineralis]